MVHDHLEIDVMLGPTAEAQHGNVCRAIFRLHIQTHQVVACSSDVLDVGKEKASCKFQTKEY